MPWRSVNGQRTEVMPIRQEMISETTLSPALPLAARAEEGWRRAVGDRISRITPVNTVTEVGQSTEAVGLAQDELVTHTSGRGEER